MFPNNKKKILGQEYGTLLIFHGTSVVTNPTRKTLQEIS
jgi:hypothetical protein